MSRQVQCKGSGRKVTAGMNAKRAACSACGRMQDLASNGRIRKHMRIVTNAQLRKLK